ncbi:hypothetical protein CSC75_12825 [Pseudoxanthomonas wuyuanensis]|nr:hypothetical protein CSC75_12825 [Pseudoxanthomonas wuyuanensis]
MRPVRAEPSAWITWTATTGATITPGRNAFCTDQRPVLGISSRLFNENITIYKPNHGDVTALLPLRLLNRPRVTTDDLPPGQPAAAFRPSRGTVRFLLLLALYAASSLAFAQSATADSDAGAAPALASVPPVVLAADNAPATTASIKSKAAEAATATLTALLPRLAASDAMPLMDRSAMFANDISHLLASYDLTKVQTGGVVTQEEGGKVQALLKRALTLLGTPYRWGGTSPESGFDCSGLVGYVFSNALGIELPRISRDMAAQSDAELIKNREELKQGDLVFFGLKGRVNHVGIYVGEGRFLHSPSRGKDVRVDSLTSGYWSNRFMQARRVAL